MLPIELIRARIAKGLTQKDLARKLGLKEQQIQRYLEKIGTVCGLLHPVQLVVVCRTYSLLAQLGARDTIEADTGFSSL